MPEPEELLWTFEAVQEGQRGVETSVIIAAQDIADFARVSQNPDPVYQSPGAPAMPTMLLSYAPLFREQIAANNGFTAFEVSMTARRQTPFTKCECRWYREVRAGDEITSERWVHEKYERRGSRFVVFRVAARNQRGEPVGEYDYTCIFDYAQAQRSDERAQRSDERAQRSEERAQRSAERAQRSDQKAESNDEGVYAGLSTQPASALAGAYGPRTLAGVSTGSVLIPLVVTETQDTMNAKDAFRLFGERTVGSNIHTDEEFAKQNIFGTTVNSGPATMAYVDQMLEQNFAPETLANGGRLLMRAITPFRSEDVVTLAGEIDAVSGGAVRCSVRGTNQAGSLVCVAEAEMKGVDGPRR